MDEWFHLLMVWALTGLGLLLHRWASYHRGKLPPGPPAVRPPLDLTPPVDEPERRNGQREFAW